MRNVAISEYWRQSAEMHLAWPNGDVNVCSALSIGIQRNLANCGEGYEPNVLRVICRE
jgi:hypothetical protein